MFHVNKAKGECGVLLVGDFFDLDRLYFAIMRFTGFHGLEDDCPFDGCEEVCENLLGLCYELRHAWQGARGLLEIYNGIHDDWFGDYPQPKTAKHFDADESNDEDEFFSEDIDGEDENTEDDYIDAERLFSRAEFPFTTERNTYFTTLISFPEAVFYALIISDLLKQKEAFLLSRKRMAETKGPLQRLDQDYYCFVAEEDLARLTSYVQQTLRTLYHCIGNLRYKTFINKFHEKTDYALHCDLKKANQVIADYSSQGFDYDDEDALTSALMSLL